ncbi:MAG: hypothetical protein ACFFBP_09250 [Promethearchaeota archaeon]
MVLILTIDGWLNGITSSIIVFTSIIFGIFYIYKGTKLKANLLIVGGFMAAFTGLLWSGPTIDLFWILLTPGNGNVSELFYVIISYVWVAPATTFSLYLGSRLLFQKKKLLSNIFTIIFFGIGILFEVILFSTIFLGTEFLFDIDTIYTPALQIVEASFARGSLGYLLILLILVGVLAINGVGSIIAAIKGTGLVRKKFTYLSITWFLFVTVAVFDALLPPVPILFIARMGMVVEVILLYLALKP